MTAAARTRGSDDGGGRKRVMVLTSVLAVVALAGVGFVLYKRHNDDSATQVKGVSEIRTTTTVGGSPSAPPTTKAGATATTVAPQTATTVAPQTATTAAPTATTLAPTTIDQCHAAFVQEMAGGAGVTGAASSYDTCSPSDWATVYDDLARLFGQPSVPGVTALQTNCVQRRANGVEPRACIGVPPPSGTR